MSMMVRIVAGMVMLCMALSSMGSALAVAAEPLHAVDACSACEPVMEAVKERVMEAMRKSSSTGGAGDTVGAMLRSIIGNREDAQAFCTDDGVDESSGRSRLSRYRSSQDIFGEHYYRTDLTPNYRTKEVAGVEKRLATECIDVLEKLDAFIVNHVRLQDGAGAALEQLEIGDGLCASLMPECSHDLWIRRLRASYTRPMTILWLSPLYIMFTVIPVLFVNAYLPLWMPGKRHRLKSVVAQQRRFDSGRDKRDR